MVIREGALRLIQVKMAVTKAGPMATASSECRD